MVGSAVLRWAGDCQKPEAEIRRCRASRSGGHVHFGVSCGGGCGRSCLAPGHSLRRWPGSGDCGGTEQTRRRPEHPSGAILFACEGCLGAAAGARVVGAHSLHPAPGGLAVRKAHRRVWDFRFHQRLETRLRPREPFVDWNGSCRRLAQRPPACSSPPRRANRMGEQRRRCRDRLAGANARPGRRNRRDGK